MNAEALLAHYARIAEAPDAIARLRRFVLDLAVRGKLVPQDPIDEPAAKLLERIRAEKVRVASRAIVKVVATANRNLAMNLATSAIAVGVDAIAMISHVARNVSSRAMPSSIRVNLLR